MKLDVCIPTRNSAKNLEQCIEAIKKCIPYNRIIVCDSNSADDTIKIAKKFGCEIHPCKGNLGNARNKLMNLVHTQFFAFIDSDVIVNKTWFNILIKSIDKETGAINGFGLPDNIILKNLRSLILFSKMKFGLQQRGFTSNTILRKEATNGIMLPDLKRCEDLILQDELKKRGWKWKFAWAICAHLKSPYQLIKEAKNDLFYISKFNNMNIVKSILRI
jgi:glycosyltransferase involved in cell wall biosynthesis